MQSMKMWMHRKRGPDTLRGDGGKIVKACLVEEGTPGEVDKVLHGWPQQVERGAAVGARSTADAGLGNRRLPHDAPRPQIPVKWHPHRLLCLLQIAQHSTNKPRYGWYLL